MQVDQFDYELPERLIAQSPLQQRDKSRLMVINPVTGEIQHSMFHDITAYLHQGDVLVLNDSRVIPARLYGVKKDTGANVEVLLTHAVSDTEWIALAKPAKRLKVGTVIQFFAKGGVGTGADEGHQTPAISGSVASRMNAQPLDSEAARQQENRLLGEAAVVETMEDGLRRLKFSLSTSMHAFLDEIGTMPLPPYIHEPLSDKDRYQTVYANPSGSVAAPTAGLHFTEELLERIGDAGVEIHRVTLHVGIGTFRPVSVDTVEEHVMHKEWYEVPEQTARAVNQARAEGRRVIAVGTTALRTLESAVDDHGRLKSGAEETGIFIYPGYQFQIVDALITNFHLPKSTLLMLVSALMGRDVTLRAYREAVEAEYRFFSFGDAMFITGRGA
ncbi:tRNA preQ1(34) S-adenosylmethionine ribosyltransferase-isomerase QueA [Alicyclobacillus sp. SO9]|uniref:tRNA preQ1(34) S-adenosylmethionine ribosyltransferase-isomerase QueA n=1 Tax=Alicyclobacillus sp. SO9 TaxID=2665646 RepID=UPI001E4EC3B2|nr:tRNA preQ1(34) S-adenosylmethionine ribosyltransferase-isomerase QueA [Alicyclobacillus sp. SO9]